MAYITNIAWRRRQRNNLEYFRTTGAKFGFGLLPFLSHHLSFGLAGSNASNSQTTPQNRTNIRGSATAGETVAVPISSTQRDDRNLTPKLKQRCEREKHACHLIVLAHAFAGALTFMRSQMLDGPDDEDGQRAMQEAEHHSCEVTSDPAQCFPRHTGTAVYCRATMPTCRIRLERIALSNPANEALILVN